jgi:hypothetical protein
MKILTIGDSFTYGDELADRTLAWPSLLGKLTNTQVTNLGLPSVGNTSMVRAVVEYAWDYDIIIVAWSHFARMEMSDANGVYDIWPGCSSKVHKQYSPHREHAINYISMYYDDEYFYQQYLINIILTQTYLKQHNKRYIMLDAFGNNIRLRWSEQYANLRNQIDTEYFLGWSGLTMMEWTHGTTKGPGGHFLEDGHSIVADKINEYIRNFGWIS